MPRLHMQVWQPGTERTASKSIFVLSRSICSLWRG